VTTSGKANTAQIELERTPPPCDRCRHLSLTIVEKVTVVFDPNGVYARKTLQLSFCNHHFGFFEALLVLHGWALIADTRARLAVREAARRSGDLR
jgi:hypothetical protein